MEATNISIKQQSSVSINVETMTAIKQRALKELSLPRLYRRQLRMINALARGIEAHPTLTNIILILMGVMLAYEVLNYEFSTSL